MSVARPALLPLIFIEKSSPGFGYVRAMTFYSANRFASLAKSSSVRASPLTPGGNPQASMVC